MKKFIVIVKGRDDDARMKVADIANHVAEGRANGKLPPDADISLLPTGEVKMIIPVHDVPVPDLVLKHVLQKAIEDGFRDIPKDRVEIRTEFE